VPGSSAGLLSYLKNDEKAMNYDFYLDGAVFEGSDGFYCRIGTHRFTFLKSRKKLRQDERGFFVRYKGAKNLPEFQTD
jgi:hypothetical protein